MAGFSGLALKGLEALGLHAESAKEDISTTQTPDPLEPVKQDLDNTKLDVTTRIPLNKLNEEFTNFNPFGRSTVLDPSEENDNEDIYTNEQKFGTTSEINQDSGTEQNVETNLPTTNTSVEYNDDGRKKNYRIFFKTVKSQIGRKYDHSAGMTGIDCSQLVIKGLSAAHLCDSSFTTKGKLANSLYLYYANNKGITPNTDEKTFRKGDLIFWYEDADNANGGGNHSDNQMYHVALCAGKSFQKNGKTYCKTIESTTEGKGGVQYFPEREMRSKVKYAAIPRETVYSTVLENASFTGTETIDPSTLV